MPTRRALVALLAPLLLLPGCSFGPLRTVFAPSGRLSSGYTQEDLRAALGTYAARFAALVGTAAEEITDAAEERRIRRRALLWQMRMLPLVQQTAFLPHPQEAYLQTLAIAILQRQYLEEGDGRAIFGPQQPVAVAAARQLAGDALAIGSRFLTDQQLRDTERAVADLTLRYPMQGTQFSFQRAIAATEALRTSPGLGSVLMLPLAPFRALEGVDSGAEAIREFNQTARRFATIVSLLPEQIRAQVELLLYDVEDRETLVQALAALESLAASGDRASLAFERLPEDLRATLAASEGAVADAAGAVDRASALLPTLDATSEKLLAASLAWREILGSSEDRAASADPDEPAFDVREVHAAATAVADATGQVRELLGDLDRLSRSGALGDAVDRAFWRAGGLLVAFFALLLGYRVLASRWERGAGPR